MTVEFRLPQFGMGMTDGTITVWYKAEGDAVLEGEPLLEVEAAKTNVEVTAPVSGVLARIVVEAGTNVPVQTVIAVIEDAGAAEVPGAAAAGAPADPAPAAAAAVSASPLARRVAAANGVDLESIEGRGAAGKVMRADVDAALGRAGDGAKVQIEPRARRAAKELGIDLGAVTGSGKNGRIVEADVRNFSAALPVAQVAAPVPPSSAPPSPPADLPGEAAYEDVRLSKMRRVIADRLTESKQTVPHFYLVANCEVDALVAARKQINDTYPDARVSLNDLVVRAIAMAMMRVPDANVSWQGTVLRRFSGVDVAVAVATDGGLITPVVRGAQAKPVRAIAAEVKYLAERARAGRLAMDEYRGGTVSVSNLGMFGVEAFSAIINPPHSCIFAIGAASERPVVRDGALAVANVMTCTLSVDHRAVDGAVAAQLLGAFKEFIERPAALLA